MWGHTGVGSNGVGPRLLADLICGLQLTSL